MGETQGVRLSVLNASPCANLQPTLRPQGAAVTAREEQLSCWGFRLQSHVHQRLLPLQPPPLLQFIAPSSAMAEHRGCISKPGSSRASLGNGELLTWLQCRHHPRDQGDRALENPNGARTTLLGQGPALLPAHRQGRSGPPSLGLTGSLTCTALSCCERAGE